MDSILVAKTITRICKRFIANISAIRRYPSAVRLKWFKYLLNSDQTYLLKRSKYSPNLKFQFMSQTQTNVNCS